LEKDKAAETIGGGEKSFRNVKNVNFLCVQRLNIRTKGWEGKKVLKGSHYEIGKKVAQGARGVFRETVRPPTRFKRESEMPKGKQKLSNSPGA